MDDKGTGSKPHRSARTCCQVALFGIFRFRFASFSFIDQFVNAPSAGLFSGLVSHVVAARFRFPQMVSKLILDKTSTNAVRTASQVASPRSSILPSLGASGAIYATVTLTACAFPDTEIALLIPPTFPIPISWGVSGLVAIDVLGVLRGWR